MRDVDQERNRMEEDRIAAAYARRSGAERYSWLNPGYVFLMQERERRVLRLLRDRLGKPLDQVSVLEIGCGTGGWLRDLVHWGARPENLTGIDLLDDRIQTARRLCAPGVVLQRGGATELPVGGDTFDLVLQSTVFSSILDPAIRLAVAKEMLRIVKPDGFILWYDFLFDNPRNPDVQGMTKREVRRLFEGCRIRLQRVTLAPPLTRVVAPRSWVLASLLNLIPVFRTHYIGTIEPP